MISMFFYIMRKAIRKSVNIKERNKLSVSVNVLINSKSSGFVDVMTKTYRQITL